MMKTLKRVFLYILFTLLANSIFGLILYFGFTFLTDISIVLAYLWNVLLIIIMLIIDEKSLKSMESGDLAKKVKEHKEPEKLVNGIGQSLKYLGSFKSDLYMFYIFILIISQVIELYPALFGESLRYFIQANSYSVLLLIAFDTLFRQFAKDRIRINRIMENLRKSLEED